MNPLKQKAIELRLEGKSYGEILKSLHLPSKGTLSLWFKKLRLTKEAKQRLARNIRIATERGLLLFNKRRTARILSENKELTNFYKSKITNLNNRELMLIGAALYWAEGRKGDGDKNRYPFVDFCNSDPNMIQVFLDFLERIFKVRRIDLWYAIHIHPGGSIKNAVNYWSRITRVPESNFNVYEAISRASNKKRLSNSLPYGTLKIRINRRQEFFKIKGLIEGIINSLK